MISRISSFWVAFILSFAIAVFTQNQIASVVSYFFLWYLDEILKAVKEKH